MVINYLKSNVLDKERKGFAITFEIMMVSLLLVFAVSVIIYFCEVMNTQRFFYDVTTSTCTAASRYGGDNSRAYQFQTREDSGHGQYRGTISDNANKYLAAIQHKDYKTGAFVLDYGPEGKWISVSPYPSEADGTVTVTLDYKLGRYGWGNIAEALIPGGGHNHDEIVLPTMMQDGQLLH